MFDSSTMDKDIEPVLSAISPVTSVGKSMLSAKSPVTSVTKSTLYSVAFLIRLIIAVFLLPIGTGKQMAATQPSSRQTIVIGSTTFTMTPEVVLCMNIMNRKGLNPWNPGVFMADCLRDQRSSTAAPGQPWFGIPGDDYIDVSEGEIVTLPCEIINRGNHSVVWNKQGRADQATHNLFFYNGKAETVNMLTMDSRYVAQFGNSTFDIRINGVTRHDAGRYECTIQTHPSTTRFIHLEVKVPVSITQIAPDYPPYVNSSYPANVRFFNESDTANITCLTEGSEPTIVTWLHKRSCRTCADCDYLSDTTTTQVVINDSYIIPRITRRRNGCYVCEAQSEVGGRKYQKVEIMVHFKPVVRGINTDIRAGPNGYVTLQCHILAFPAARVTWRDYNGTILLEGELADDDPSRLIFVNLEPENDYGNYTCEATNFLGTTTRVIEISGRPVAPVIVSPKWSTRKHAYELCWTLGVAQRDSNINEIPTSIYVVTYVGEWIEIKDGTYRVVYSHYDPLREVLQESQIDKRNEYIYCYTIRDLRPNTTYNIWLHGENQYGAGDTATYKINTVIEDLPTTTANAITPASGASGKELRRRVGDSYNNKNAASRTTHSFITCIVLVFCTFLLLYT